MGDLGVAQVTAEDFATPLKSMGEWLKIGLVVCDDERRVLHVNAGFEETSGIRETDAMGKPLSASVRDQAFGALVQDLFDRAQSSAGGSVSEDFDFSGMPHKVHVICFGTRMGSMGGASVKGYALVAVKAEG